MQFFTFVLAAVALTTASATFVPSSTPFTPLSAGGAATPTIELCSGVNFAEPCAGIRPVFDKCFKLVYPKDKPVRSIRSYDNRNCLLYITDDCTLQSAEDQATPLDPGETLEKLTYNFHSVLCF